MTDAKSATDLRKRRMRTLTGRMTRVTAGLLLLAPLVSCAPTAPPAATHEASTSATPRAVAQTATPRSPASAGQLPFRPSSTACAAVVRYDAYKVDGGGWRWSITGTRVDMGSSDHAAGSANDDLTAYVVAPGDSFTGIGARFCIDAVHLALINRRDPGDLYAGETIRLFPDGAAEDYITDADS